MDLYKYLHKQSYSTRFFMPIFTLLVKLLNHLNFKTSIAIIEMKSNRAIAYNMAL